MNCNYFNYKPDEEVSCLDAGMAMCAPNMPYTGNGYQARQFAQQYGQSQGDSGIPYNPYMTTQTGLPPLPTGIPAGPVEGQLPMPGVHQGTQASVIPGIQPGTSLVQLPLPSSQIPSTGSTLGGAQIAPQILQNPLYTPGFLRSQIGSKVRVEFLIGTGTMTDRIGTLVGVGASYVLILLQESDDILMGDLYSIKFVTFYR